MTNKIVRQVEGSGLALLVLLTVIFFVIAGSNAAENTSILSATEARILVYISPIGERLRASGSDIAMEQQTSAQLDQANFYYFWVYNAKRQSNGSVTIGYYAVNKHTADVWDTVEQKQISSKLMVGVQRIIRGARHIGERKPS